VASPLNLCSVASHLVKAHDFRSCLQVGGSRWHLFDWIPCPSKTFVSSNHHERPSIIAEGVEFLTHCGDKFDLIVIDGDKSASGSRMEIMLASRLLSDRGQIVVHDTLPESGDVQGSVRRTDRWCGEVWLGLLQALRALPEFSIRTYASDSGISVLFRGELDRGGLPLGDISWAEFETGADRWLNVVPEMDLAVRHHGLGRMKRLVDRVDRISPSGAVVTTFYRDVSMLKAQLVALSRHAPGQTPIVLVNAMDDHEEERVVLWLEREGVPHLVLEDNKTMSEAGVMRFMLDSPHFAALRRGGGFGSYNHAIALNHLACWADDRMLGRDLLVIDSDVFPFASLAPVMQMLAHFDYVGHGRPVTATDIAYLWPGFLAVSGRRFRSEMDFTPYYPVVYTGVFGDTGTRMRFLYDRHDVSHACLGHGSATESGEVFETVNGFAHHFGHASLGASWVHSSGDRLRMRVEAFRRLCAGKGVEVEMSIA
jgi:hypothetical protein